MEQSNNNCPICGAGLDPEGIGKVCPNCGYAHIESPMTNTFASQAKKKTIGIVAAIVLVVWVIPEIIVLLLK